MTSIFKKFILTTLLALFASQASALFIQPDWFDPTEPGVGTNRYAYSGNNPVNQVDPGGNEYRPTYGSIPYLPYDYDTTKNPLVRGLNNALTEVGNIPSSVANIALDLVYGAGNLYAPHAGTLENMAVTTPTAFDDIGAGVFGILGRGAASISPKFANPANLNFSQRSAGGNGRADALRQSMSQSGWNGPPVDVVRSPNGSLVAIDNTRVAVARELGISRIPVNVRTMDEALPESMAGRFGDSTTWGQALQHRTSNNRLSPNGTNAAPRMQGTPSQSSGGFRDWVRSIFQSD